MNRPRSAAAFAATAAACAATFLALTLPRVPNGPVVGTGQDEWYNAVRGLKALYEHLNPCYFVHPALYYELLAFLYGVLRAVVWIMGAGAGSDFLDYFLAHQERFLELARYASVGSGVIAVVGAVWLGTLLAGARAGLLAGVLLATLPLLQTMATSIRVDALAVAAWIAGAALLIRHHRSPSRRSLFLACAGIGVAAAANYPGALLLVLLAWSRRVHAREGTSPPDSIGFARASALAFAVFLLLNPYVVLDLGHFLFWFTFTAKVPFLVHPHAEEPSAARYVTLLLAQGAPAIAASVAGAAAIVRPRTATGALGAFGIAYLAAFSAMQTQYDRFALPALSLLCIAGAAALSALLARRLPAWLATGMVLALSVLVVWSAAVRLGAEEPSDPGPDYRAEMFGWIAANVPPDATLIIESDTLPILQTVYDPGDHGEKFHSSLRKAFEGRHPGLPTKIVKTQFIAVVYNYDAKLLEAEPAFFLASSENRELIAANRALLPEPAAFYDALDTRAKIVHESGGFHERLVLYSIGAR